MTNDRNEWRLERRASDRVAVAGCISLSLHSLLCSILTPQSDCDSSPASTTRRQDEEDDKPAALLRRCSACRAAESRSSMHVQNDDRLHDIWTDSLLTRSRSFLFHVSSDIHRRTGAGAGETGREKREVDDAVGRRRVKQQKAMRTALVAVTAARESGGRQEIQSTAAVSLCWSLATALLSSSIH